MIVHAGGLFSRAPRLETSKDGKRVERFITVQRAPEPADLWWENAVASSNIVLRRVSSWMAYLILLAISCGIQGLLTYLSEQARLTITSGRHICLLCCVHNLPKCLPEHAKLLASTFYCHLMTFT